MGKQSKTLQLMAVKLGLNDEDKVLSKAAEFERLLQMKSTANTITDTAKAVICLDLAASFFKFDLDLKTAIKCSGLKSPSYTNSKKIVENLLELNTDRLTVPGLCLMLQCNVQELAERILEEYKRTAKIELDMSLPQYVCMAVHQACRISKVKVPKSKLVDKSQLKPGQWGKLDMEWTQFTDKKFAVAKKKRGKSAKTDVIEQEDKMDVDGEVIKKDEQITEPQIEPYEDWKQRILEAAYKELRKQNKNLDKQHKNLDKQNKNLDEQHKNSDKHNENQSKQGEKLSNKQMVISFSPRRSPRKTPQKYEPYKSPVKNTPVKAVRLLFNL